MRRSRAIQSGQAVDVAIVCKKKKIQVYVDRDSGLAIGAGPATYLRQGTTPQHEIKRMI